MGQHGGSLRPPRPPEAASRLAEVTIFHEARRGLRSVEAAEAAGGLPMGQPEVSR
jgi:hypothetical protein